MDIGSGMAIGVSAIAVAGMVGSVTKTLSGNKGDQCRLHQSLEDKIDAIQKTLSDLPLRIIEVLKREK